MKTLADSQFKRDLIKLLCLLGVLGGTGAAFLLTPALSTSTLIAVTITILLSPLVKSLERRGYPRIYSILGVFTALGLLILIAGSLTFSNEGMQWDSLKTKAPAYFQSTVENFRSYETSLKAKFPWLESIQLTESWIAWAKNTGQWFVTHGPSLMGNLLTSLVIVPILAFFLLKDGRAIRKRIFELVPNRFFESIYLISYEIGTALSDYIRAKLIEGFLVGALTFAGLALIQAPYAIVLALLAGVTNIIPYVGPILGAIPGILIVLFDPEHHHLIWPIITVYLVVNAIDMVLIFPFVVAKLINLHPVILLAAVVIGQQYYGLIGMLISIPIVTAAKVVLEELYSLIYHQRAGNSYAPYARYAKSSSVAESLPDY